MALTLGCGGESLPDPESRGAAVMRARCAGCHRLYAPATMTREMWRVQVERMRGLFAQRGLPWLTTDEERVLMDYLAVHAGTS
jgi:hypothetical protein